MGATGTGPERARCRHAGDTGLGSVKFTRIVWAENALRAIVGLISALTVPVIATMAETDG